MKYLAIIFSVYMTILAILPCQDREDMIASVMHVTVQKSHSANDERGQETCPPFCTCSCCSTARTLTAKITIKVFTKSITREYPNYSTLAIQDQPINIWQPPQIG
ncbi:DUF6660 family protein [Mucilaginibacter rubeus]|uniref:Uncharacterized protein n=1 Tax=Mucilaginibacter rubeus TaxID=2027860 RepID=A0A5C1HTE6_9SPHI|nr:DUF6660 family protein [Mucilaginibacter rubeus]QEM09074.1 hypothetical protein DEO27_003255 [Mucilaginibacter rubeus]